MRDKISTTYGSSILYTYYMLIYEAIKINKKIMLTK